MSRSHRHVLPGGILTGPTVPTGEGTSHKHSIVGGDGNTSTDPGTAEDDHRHKANGQGTSGPIPIKDDSTVGGGASEGE